MNTQQPIETETRAPKTKDDGRFDDYERNVLGAYLREVRHVPLLSPEEELALAERIQGGDEEARSRMVRSNLRLVIKIAKAYVNRGVSFMDLIEEGNIGLMRGVERFDPSKGFRFSTYGSWWIRQAIERAVFKQARTIRVPVHVMEDIEKLKRVRRKLEMEFGREPTIEESMEESGFDGDYIEKLENACTPVCSIESSVDESGDILLKETLVDPEENDPVESIFDRECEALLGQMIDGLSEREQNVLRLRFGIGGEEEPMTLREIGRRLGVTRERVRQIETEALGRLRQRLEEVKELRHEAA